MKNQIHSGAHRQEAKMPRLLTACRRPRLALLLLAVLWASAPTLYATRLIPPCASDQLMRLKIV